MTHRSRVSPSASHIAVALPSGGSDVEAARSVLQDRIGLWAKWVCILSSSFYIANVVSWPFVMPTDVLSMLRHPGSVCHLAASVMFGVVWLIARRSPFMIPTLRGLDLGTLIAGCLLYSLMAYYLIQMQEAFGKDGEIAVYAGVLASANTILSRAIIVPSTAKRTFWASTISMSPLVPLTIAATGSAAAVITIASWCAVTVAVATLGSQVIFGLRTEAARVRRLGQYVLEDKIGAGGMGVVYRARHAMLRRPTAIKLLPPDRAGETNLLRFEREVQLTAELSHPNTVAIYDYGRTPDGIFYYAMEYLEGVTLDELVARDGPQPPGRVIHILRQVCGALAEAHGRGLLHRDIKPANIILTERGGEPDVAKVVDFGLVKAFAVDGPAVTMARSMVVAGTPLYMPPEALTAPEKVDPRSDLYALGAVGYFLLTGHPVFEATTTGEAFAHHLNSEPIPPSTRAPAPLPPDLEASILRCLAKKVEDRPASARALQVELSRSAKAAPWSTEDAAAWWQRFRSSAAPVRTSEPSTPDEALTVTVDLGGRLPDAASPQSEST